MRRKDEQAGYIAVEDSDEDADWIKSLRWDLPTDLRQLVLLLYPSPDLAGQKRALSHLMNLPAWDAAPASIQTEAAAFLAGRQAIG